MVAAFNAAADIFDPPPKPAWWDSPLAFGVETGRGRYKRARHLEVMERECLAAIAAAERLLLEVSIRHGKTQFLERLMAWFLGRNPDKRIILGGHHADFAARRGRVVRDLLIEYGPSMFGIRVSRRSESASRWDIEGHAGGMITVGVDGAPIGEGADLMVIDDPLKSFKAAMSPLVRRQVVEWITGTMLSRLEPGATVLMALARWHEDDPGGVLLRESPEEAPWRSVRLPAICDDPAEDPMGREEGEALWPERYPLPELEKRRAEMSMRLGPVVWLAQAQQRPTTLDGGMFPESRWGFIRADELAMRSQGLRWVRSWDLAATEDDGDFTVGVLLTRLPDGRTVAADVRRGRWSAYRVREEIVQAAADDPPGTLVVLPQDPGQAGKDQAQQHVAMLAGHAAIARPQSGSKEVRAAGWSAQQQAGNVLLVASDWNGIFVVEHKGFPRGAHDDQVDAASSGFNELAGVPLGAARGASPARRPVARGAALARRSGDRVH